MTLSSMLGIVGVDSGDAASHDTSSGNAVDLPRETDVLLGRGHPYQNNIGNKLMLRFVAKYKDEYGAAPREKKRLLANTILDKVLEKGTRFLRRGQRADGTGIWEEVNRNVAFEKIWHALRSKDHVPKANNIRVKNDPAPPEVAPAIPESMGALVQDILVNLRQATQATNQLLQAVSDVIVRPSELVTLPGSYPAAATSRDVMLWELLRGRMPLSPTARYPASFLSGIGPISPMLPVGPVQGLAPNFSQARNLAAIQPVGRDNPITGITQTATNSSFVPLAQQTAPTLDIEVGAPPSR